MNDARTSQTAPSLGFVRRVSSWTKPLIAGLLLGLVAAVGWVDYLTGVELSVSLLYLVPITIGTWVAGRSIGNLVDEPGVTRSLKMNLETAGGYEVLTENDSALALNAAREFHPHLVLLDVLMPHLDGCDVAARIHADPELAATPIVFLTALAKNEATGGHAAVAGATVYLAKPVDTPELIKCIEQTLSQKLHQRHHALSLHL